MATVYTLTTPKEAWALVSHFLGNYLLVIAMNSSPDLGAIALRSREQRERVVSDNRGQLIGSMYMIVRNLNKHGHSNEGGKVQQILDMIADQDVTDPNVRDAIHAKQKELDTGVSEFEETSKKF